MANPSLVDLNTLLVAAFWHDHGKLFEYALVGETIEVTAYGRRIGHVAGSVMEMLALVYDEQQLFCIPERDAVIHCMLSHHGRREWGSPVEPVTPEAYILHVADMLSSREGQ